MSDFLIFSSEPSNEPIKARMNLSLFLNTIYFFLDIILFIQFDRHFSVHDRNFQLLIAILLQNLFAILVVGYEGLCDFFCCIYI